MICGSYKRALQTLLGVAAGFAVAAEAPHLGFQVLGSCPTGSMRGDFATHTGYGLGVFGGWEAGPGKVLRLAYDGVWYPDSSGSAGKAGVPAAAVVSQGDLKPRSHSVTVQYLFYPGGDDENFYWKAGLGAMNYLTRIPVTATYAGGQQASLTVLNETGTKLACLAGLGYDLGRSWGVMAQYSFITRNQHTLGGVQAGITYRF
jgi:hypothetical protein